MAKTTNKINSYTEVFGELSRNIGCTVTVEDLFKVGLEKIIRVTDNQACQDCWEKLVGDVTTPSSTERVFVRSHGRNGSGTGELLMVLKEVFGRDFTKDPSNNLGPKTLLANLCGNNYEDYQISHVFEERTNNPLLFTAPWMICYTPKIIDPFTGHESKGFPAFREEFVDWAFQVNAAYIDEYNAIIQAYWKKLKSVLNATSYEESFQKHMVATLAPIHKDAEKLSKTDRVKYYLTEFEKI